MSAKKRMKFKTELAQLMDIIVHSLYSHREIFLRELISNASDAIDRVRFEALTNKDLAGEHDWQVRIVPNEGEGTLTVSDNGIGMSAESIARELGTIARSGTKAFLENMKKTENAASPELIGQFGVGFYSAFMVADEVTVVSKTIGEEPGVKWTSKGEGSFTIEEVEKDGIGTEITLHMREDAKEYLGKWRIQEIAKRFSSFIEHPIVLVTEEEKDGETETKEDRLNDQKAIWMRAKSEIKEEEYNEFYKHLSHDFSDPAKTIHYSAEGTLEFKALLFLPARRPFDYFMTEPKPSLHLYVKRVFITDACEALLPLYLRFVKGMVDSSDLPLNVSREMLQDNPLLTKIQRNLVTRILAAMAEMKEKEYDDYCSFFKEFGSTLKEGVSRDFANREKLADLLLFESSRTEAGKFLTLSDYVDQMQDDQKEIFYLCGDNIEMLRNSPYLEVFKERGQDVLLMAEPVDPFFVEAMREYKGKQFKAVDKGAVDSDEPETEESKEAEKTYKKLLKFLGKKIEEVKDIRLSRRLKESAACLVADDDQMNAQMARIMKNFGQGQETPRILELNPDHPAVKTMLALYEENPRNKDVAEYARLFYDQALIAEGSRIKDPAAFAKRVNSLIARTPTSR